MQLLLNIILPTFGIFITSVLSTSTCPCGYAVNSTTSDDYAIFTEIWETDFLHTSDVTWGGIGDTGWDPQVYNVSPSDSAGPYGKAALLSTVIANPLASIWDWGGEGVLGGDPGLQLWVRNTTIGDNDTGYYVPMAEIAPSRDDMLYGSFRAGLKFTAVNGTCGAFFWYRNNTQEIDLEHISANHSAIDLVVQSPEAQAAGDRAAATSDYQNHQLSYELSDEYHEIRFDWLPDRVDFYADGVLLDTFTDNIPDGPGHIILNHWSNGNPSWSAGPPLQDAVLTVSYVKAYFNTSGQSSAATTADNERCSASYFQANTCLIPDQTSPPNPLGSSGNLTGRTTFLTPGIGDATGNGSSSASSSSGGSTMSKAATDALEPSVWVVLGVLGLVMLV